MLFLFLIPYFILSFYLLIFPANLRCFHVNSVGCYQISGRKSLTQKYNRLKSNRICFAFNNIKSGLNIEVYLLHFICICSFNIAVVVSTELSEWIVSLRTFIFYHSE